VVGIGWSETYMGCLSYNVEVGGALESEKQGWGREAIGKARPKRLTTWGSKREQGLSFEFVRWAH